MPGTANGRNITQGYIVAQTHELLLATVNRTL